MVFLRSLLRPSAVVDVIRERLSTPPAPYCSSSSPSDTSESHKGRRGVCAEMADFKRKERAWAGMFKIQGHKKVRMGERERVSEGENEGRKRE